MAVPTRPKNQNQKKTTQLPHQRPPNQNQNQNQKKTEKTKKTKKQNFSDIVWSEANVCFFWFSSRFFVFFCGDLEQTKKSQGFCFLDKSMVKELWKNKKTHVFCFVAWIVFTCLLKICPKTHPKKKLSFFLVFCLTSSKSSFKKNPKNMFLIIFQGHGTKTILKNRGKPKNKHEPQRKHSLKNFVFLVFSGFFGFGLGFGSGVSDESVFLFLVLAFGLGVSDESTPSREILLKKHVPLAALVSTISLRVFPKIIPK